MRRTLLLAAALCLSALALAAGAKGDDVASPRVDEYADVRYPALDALASHWARRPVAVECAPTWEVWNADPVAAGSYGYTWMDADWTRVEPDVCPAALRAGADLQPLELYQTAAAILIVTHESWHLRQWFWRFNEARVECAAIKHFRASARLLGADDDRADALYSQAWAFHTREITVFAEYRYRDCHAQRP